MVTIFNCGPAKTVRIVTIRTIRNIGLTLFTATNRFTLAWRRGGDWRSNPQHKNFLKKNGYTFIIYTKHSKDGLLDIESSQNILKVRASDVYNISVVAGNWYTVFFPQKQDDGREKSRKQELQDGVYSTNNCYQI